MLQHLPELVDPLALADKRRQFKGSLPLAKLSRLQDVLSNRVGEVRFELNFGKEGKIAAVQGRVEAELELQCQCCLQPVQWRVDSVVRLGIVKSIDEANLLPESFEPLLLEEEIIPLADIVQEELLLAIPTIPQHPQCDGVLTIREKPKNERENPFAVLADLIN